LMAHAAVALENSRLFSQIAQASRHWHDIFDAIQDLIVVHDEGYRVLRVNRAMAEVIGSPPRELIGMPMRSITGSGDGDMRGCPFCLVGSGGGEYQFPARDRTFLISTSGIHGVINEGLQTIHVLKDVTERREAERRYSEVFNNIQEGLFFST